MTSIEALEQRQLLTVAISGLVFDDVNGDKVKQASEAAISGAIVYIDTTFNGRIDPSNTPDGGATEVFTTSDASGNYSLLTDDTGSNVHIRVRLPGLPEDTDRILTVTGAVNLSNVNLAVSHGTVKGTVFVDTNKDGIKSIDETGFAGATVFADTAVNGVLNGVYDVGEPMATTAPDGTYTLNQVTPGSVTIRIIQPSGYSSAPLTISLKADETLTSQDVPLLVQTGTVSGTVFVDADGDGQRDAGEIAKSNVTVFLDMSPSNGVFDGSDVATITDANGGYTFSQVTPGTFKVQAVPPTGFIAPAPSITLAVGENQSGRNVPLQNQTGTISGIVFDDADHDGSKSVTENGLGNIVVFLDNDNSGMLSTGDTIAITAQSTGTYTFNNVPAGPVKIIVQPPMGYTGTTIVTTLASNQVLTAQNFGLHSQTGTISGVVFEDTDGNGIRNGAEPGRANVAVFVDDGDGVFQQSEKVTFTDSAGSYSFSGVANGEVKIAVIAPADFTSNPKILTLMVPGEQSNNLTNIALEPHTGVVKGTVYQDLDRNSALTTADKVKTNVTVFIDQNKNGTLDPGEPQTTSDLKTGAYSFTKVPLGEVTVTTVAVPGSVTIPATFNLVSGSDENVPHNVGLQLKVQLNQAPLTYTTGTPAIQVASNTLISTLDSLMYVPGTPAILNIKIIGRKQKDSLILTPTGDLRITNGDLYIRNVKIGRVTTLQPGVSVQVTFDSTAFSADGSNALNQILNNVRFSTPRNRASSAATVQVQLQLGTELFESTRKLQIVKFKR